MTTLFIINAVAFSLLSLIWDKDSWLNFFIKSCWFCVAFANAFFAMQLLGYVVRV